MNSIKLAISFISGIVVCGFLLFGVRNILPIRAETDNLTAQSENTSQTFINMLPDIEKIYHDSLTKPFIKAESKIYDPDIASFYHDLVGNSILNDHGTETPVP